MTKKNVKKRMTIEISILGIIILILLAGIGGVCLSIKHNNEKIRTQDLLQYNEKDRLEVSYTPQEKRDIWEKKIPSSFVHPSIFTTPFDDVNEKNENIMYGQTIEFKFKNVSSKICKDWEMEIVVSEDMYLNKAWNGEVEIHQYDEKNIGTYNVMNLNKEDCKDVEYLELGELVLFPLKKGDKIVYHPSEEHSENAINPDTIGVTIGFIFYTGSEDASFSSLNFKYRAYQSYSNAPLIWISFSLLIVLLLLASLLGGEYLINRKFEEFKIEAEKNARIAEDNLKKQKDEILFQLNITYAISDIYDSVYVIDIDNDKWEEIHAIPSINQIFIEGKTNQERLNNTVSKLMKPEYYENAMKYADISTWKERLKDKDSLFFDFEGISRGWCRVFLIVAQRDSKGDVTHVIFVVQEINEQKKNELDLQEALKEAEKANNAKTVFLNNVSHDIRTPMNAIIGFTNLCKNHIDDKAQVSDYLNKISISSDHLLSLINDVLDMSRIESGKTSIASNILSLPSLFEEIKTIVQADINKRNQIFESSLFIKNEYIIGDKLRLRQIFINLLGNAMKFTPEGGKIIFSIRQIASSENKAKYEMIIEDNGIGMTKEFQKVIFLPFTREKTSTVSGIQGTGLGMAITKNLIDMMGGSIEVDSEVGKGTIFTIQCEFDVVNKIDEETEEKENKNKEFSFKGKKILLVEDNLLNQEIANEILKEAGFIVTTCDDGDEAVLTMKNAKKGDFDLILMDIQMPKMNGYEATKKIRELEEPYKNSIPIIAMTANAFQEDKKAAFEAGMNGHISKPVNVSVLLETLKKIIN